MYAGQFGDHHVRANLRQDDNSAYGDKTTGGLSYGYDLSRQWRATMVSSSTGFRAPTFNETVLPRLRPDANSPETSRNLEASLRYQDGGSQARLTVYRNRVHDLIVTQRPCSVKGYLSCANNVNRAVLEGVSPAWAAAGTAPARADLDWQNPHDADTGKRLARRASQLAKFSVNQGLGRLGPGRGMAAEQPPLRQCHQHQPLGGYGLVNLTASRALSRDWQVQARWNNVGNKHYEQTKDYGVSGSTLFVNLVYQP